MPNIVQITGRYAASGFKTVTEGAGVNTWRHSGVGGAVDARRQQEASLGRAASGAGGSTSDRGVTWGSATWVFGGLTHIKHNS